MKQRIITGIVAALVFLPLVYIGGAPFIILIYAMASIALLEIFQMKKIPFFSFPTFFSLVLLWIFLLPTEYIEGFFHIDEGKTGIILVGVLIFLSYTVLVKNQFTFDHVGYCVLALLYVGIGFYYIIATREEGLIPIFYGLILIWATDSGAYFTGRAFGRRKLWPDISPNKTIEGFLGGIVCALIVAIIFYFFAGFDNSTLIRLLIASIILSVFGQLGDLVESALKRHYNVKDSGNLLPGHGGILDRVDSWLFVMPLLHFLNIL